MPSYPFTLPFPVNLGMISTIGANSLGSVDVIDGSVLGNGTWFVASTAVFIPFRIGCTLRVASLHNQNASGISGNCDIGIYDERGTLLVSSGSTAVAGAAIQDFDVADTTLGPGLYYFAYVLDNTASSLTRMVLSIAAARPAGIAQMASAFPLPAVATMTTASASVTVPTIFMRTTGDALPGLNEGDEAVPPLVHITPWHTDSVNLRTQANYIATATPLAGLASATWTTANLAIYVPFTLHRRTIIKTLFHFNGTTVGNNCDLGIYDRKGRRLISTGTTVTASTSTVQTHDIADTTLGPGLYYMAIAVNNTTNTSMFSWAAPTTTLIQLGIRQQATAFPLPVTATFADATLAFLPLFGVSTRTFI